MIKPEQVISHIFLLCYLVCVIAVILRTLKYADSRTRLSNEDLLFCLNVGGIGIGLLIISIILIV